MSKTENTKDKLGLHDIDDKTKKDLFNKFVQAGGQVVQEKKKSGLSDFDREKQMNYYPTVNLEEDEDDGETDN